MSYEDIDEHSRWTIQADGQEHLNRFLDHVALVAKDIRVDLDRTPEGWLETQAGVYARECRS